MPVWLSEAKLIQVFYAQLSHSSRPLTGQDRSVRSGRSRIEANDEAVRHYEGYVVQSTGKLWQCRVRTVFAPRAIGARTIPCEGAHFRARWTRISRKSIAVTAATRRGGGGKSLQCRPSPPPCNSFPDGREPGVAVRVRRGGRNEDRSKTSRFGSGG